MARMGRDKNDPVCHRHMQSGQIGRTATGGSRDPLFGWQARLLHVEAVQAAPSGITEQDDLAESGIAQKLQSRRHVVKGEFVLETDVVTHRTR